MSYTSSESWTLSWGHMQSFSANMYVSSLGTSIFMSWWFKCPDFASLSCHWPISGDWWEGSTFTAKWHDDEVHGPEAWSRPQTDLPYRQAETGSLGMRVWPFTPPVLHQAHSIMETLSPLKLYWSITVIAVVISECLSLCLFVSPCSHLFWCPLHLALSPLILMIGSVN